jgi:hypothetical protein
LLRGVPLGSGRFVMWLNDEDAAHPSFAPIASSRRRTRHAAFRFLLGIALVVKPPPYNMLITPEAKAFQR